jgi:hypothetical protein
MEMKKRMLVLLTLVILGGYLVPAMPVAAASNPPDDGIVIWNEDYTLAADEELDGDLVVFNGDASLESGSRIRGNAIVWNGSANVDGAIEGNLVTTNGDIRLGEDALVEGDVVCSWNCDIEQEEGARVNGDIVEGPSLRGIPFAQWSRPGLRIQVPPPDQQPFWISGAEQLLRWILRIVRSIVTVLVIAAIGGVVALIWPEATARVGLTAFQSPGASLGMGFLTLVAGITLITVLAITICLSPAAALIALALSAAALFGWVAIGARVGRRLLETLNAGDVAPLWVASLGTLIITLITMGLSAAFCLAPLGWLLMLVIGCFGLGAVALTRFGTTPYVPSRGRKIPEPPPPPSATGEIPEPSSPTWTEEPPESPTGDVEDEEAENA